MLVMLMGAVNAAQCANPSDTSLTVLGVMWGNSTHALAPGPGATDVPLTVLLQSSGSNCDMDNVQGVLQMGIVNVAGVTQLAGKVSNFNGSATAVVNLPNQAGYSTFPLTFYLNLAPNASVGPNVAYTYPLYVSWTYNDNVSGRASQEFNLYVPDKGSAELVFNTGGASLVAGQINNITVQVSNIGTGDATGITVPVPSSSGAELMSQQEQIQTLAPGATGNIALSLFVPADLGGQTLQLSPYYQNPYGYNTSVTGGLQLYVLQPEGTLNVTASTDTLTAGRVDTIWINLTNYGTSAIKNLAVSFTPGSSLNLLGSDGTVTVPDLPAGGEVSIPLTVYPTSSATVTSLEVTTSYFAGSVSRTLNFLTPGYVNMSVVSSSVIPSVPEPGAIFSLTSTLDNIGSITADAVSVTPIPPAGITVLGQSTSFIGDMGVYSPTAFTLSFTASSSTATGVYTIPVRVQYINNIAQPESQIIYYTVGVGESVAVTATTGNVVVGGGFGSGFGSGNFVVRGNFTGGNFIRRNTTGGNPAGSPGGGSGQAQAAAGTSKSGTGGAHSTIELTTVDGIGIIVVVVIIAAAVVVLMRRRGQSGKDKTKAHHA